MAAARVEASKRYFEYFTVTIRNDHTRNGYFRACRVFSDKMFSYFVEKGVLVYNPARGVATGKVRRNAGKTPAFEMNQVVQLRDRALISVVACGFSRLTAITDLKVRDYVQQGRPAFLRLHGKGGVEVDIPVHSGS